MIMVFGGKKIKIIEYNTYFKKLIGLTNIKKKLNYGIRLKRCNSIHTFFMKQNIDICITTKDNEIIFIKKNLSKNKIILPIKKGYYTYELPLNSLSNLKIGDVLKNEII